MTPKKTGGAVPCPVPFEYPLEDKKTESAKV